MNTSLHSMHVSHPLARICGAYGYRVEGDQAFLNAELAAVGEPGVEWALQLWACDAAEGFPAVKVAEVPVGRLPASGFAAVAGHAAAMPPAGQRQQRMALALAAGYEGHFDQIHDVAEFAHAEGFLLPRLAGQMAFRIDGGSAAISAERIENPRGGGTRSGTLTMELWALPAPYAGGAFSGQRVAGAQLGVLDGEHHWQDLRCDLPAAAMPGGRWTLTLMLREWTPAGFVTRDFCNFAQPVDVAEPAPPEEQSAGANVPQATAPAAAAAAAAPKVEAPKVEAPKAEAPKAETSKTETSKTETSKAETPKAETPKAETSAPTPRDPAPAAAKPKSPAAGTRVSVNTATAAALAEVKGLNAKVAQGIVAARPYKSLDDVTRAKGMGDKLLAKVRNLLSL